jgi:hypothetical protein
MLGFFSKQPDHPFADSREVKRICADIATCDPSHALKEAGAWLESIAHVEGLRLGVRVECMLQLDDAASPQARRVGRDAIHQGRSNPQQEARLWALARNYWQQLVIAYESVRQRIATGEKDSGGLASLRPLLLMRLVHARAALLKLDQFHYALMGGEFWAALGAIYLEADAEGWAQQAISLYLGQPATSIEREYLKALLFQASAMDSLLPVEIELAERLIAHFLPRFKLTREVRPENVYWVDAAKPVPPTRLAKLPEVNSTLRFFNGGEALAAIEAVQAQIAAAQRIPSEINLGGQYATADVSTVLEHLAMCWAPKPPMRKDARHRVKSRLIVAHGMDDIHGYLSGHLTDHARVETWLVDDVSLGGMSVQVPISRQDWLRVGVLVAMQPEGGTNWLLGTVRRFARISSSQGQVGTETLSKTPRAVIADAEGLQTEAILLDQPVVGEYVRMALPTAALEDKVALTFELDGKRARLHPREILVAGIDFVIANYFVQSHS